MATRQVTDPLLMQGAKSVNTADRAATPRQRGLRAWLLRLPLYYKLIIANGVVAVGAVVACALMVAAAVRANPYARTSDIVWPLVPLTLVAAGVVNAVIVRIALKPLRNLVDAAVEIQNGADQTRAAVSPFGDADLGRVLVTFNTMLDSVSAYRRRLREVAIRAIDAGEAERLRVSRELHDGIAQSLSALLVQLRVARASADGTTAAALTDAAGRLSSIIEELRTLAQGLRPPALDMIGVTAAIIAHARNVTEASGVRVEAQVERIDGLLAPEAELTLYRVVQEGLLNVVRHAHTDLATLVVTRDANTVTATVTDGGRGFDVKSALTHGALGLFGMSERAAYVGGYATVESREGEGTTVRVLIPIGDTRNV